MGSEVQTLPLLVLFWCYFLIHHVFSQRSTYIVHMDKSSMPKAYSTCHHWYSTTLSSMRTANVDASDAHRHPQAKLVHTYDNAFHGFTAVLSEDELEVFKSSPGFISAHKDRPISPDTTQTSKFLGLNTASGIWPASRYGEDVIIGVVDSGIWPESPSFRDEGLPPIPLAMAHMWHPSQPGAPLKEFRSSAMLQELRGGWLHVPGWQSTRFFGMKGATNPMLLRVLIKLLLIRLMFFRSL